MIEAKEKAVNSKEEEVVKKITLED